MPLPATAPAPTQRAARPCLRDPGRVHCRGQRLLDEVGLHVPAVTTPGPVSPAGEGPDTAPIPAQRPQPGKLPLPRPRERHGNRPRRDSGRPTGPTPTGPGRGARGVRRHVEPAGERPEPRTTRPPSRPDLELPRHWTVNFEVLDGVNDGKVKLSSPQARGWAKVIRPFPDAVKEAITEARIYVAEQGHAAWRGCRVELDVITEHDDPDAPPPPKVADLAEVKARADKKWQRTFSKDSLVRPDQAAIESWSMLPPKPDGSPGGWLSPGVSRVFKRPPKGVLAKRREAGLPTTWEELQASGTEATG